VSARSRSRPWFQDGLDLRESGAACLRGYAFALRLVPAWVLGDLELSPTARVWFVCARDLESLRAGPEYPEYGFPFALLLTEPERQVCASCGAVKPSAVTRDSGARPVCDTCAWLLQLTVDGKSIGDPIG
jgi:hypothetical protein